MVPIPSVQPTIKRKTFSCRVARFFRFWPQTAILRVKLRLR